MHVRERKINATAFVAFLAAAWAFVVPARVRAATFVKDVMLIGGRSLDMPLFGCNTLQVDGRLSTAT